jgi:hypothetical protein
MRIWQKCSRTQEGKQAIIFLQNERNASTILCQKDLEDLPVGRAGSTAEAHSGKNHCDSSD